MNNTADDSLVPYPHILWVGCGDLLARTADALRVLKEQHKARFTFIDIRDPDLCTALVPSDAAFYNVSDRCHRSDLRKHLLESSLTHIFVANWPPQHLLTSFKFSELCPAGKIIISKPLDTNFPLIETVAAGAWPDITEKIFVHDHYRNKGAVQPIFQVFPVLLERYGRLNTFELYLLEHRTIEDERRLDALNEGVIFDLASHLFAFIQLFFLHPPHPALCIPGHNIMRVSAQIGRVARGRYINCDLGNRIAETFAAIEVTVTVVYKNQKTERESFQDIPGLVVVGKGVKPSRNTPADLKGMRFNQEGLKRSVNLSRNEVNPPLSSLAFEIPTDGNLRENGFHAPVVNALSHSRAGNCVSGTAVTPLMPFEEAAANSRLLEAAMRKGSDLIYYQSGDTLETIMAKCVAAGCLDPKWLVDSGYADIGFS